MDCKAERARDRRIRRNSREACARLLGTPFDLFNKVETPRPPEHGALCFCVYCMGEHKPAQYRCEREG